MTNERIQQGGKPGWGCLQSAHTVTVLCKRMAVFKHNLDVWKLERLQQEAGTALTAQEFDWWRIICVCCKCVSRCWREGGRCFWLTGRKVACREIEVKHLHPQLQTGRNEQNIGGNSTGTPSRGGKQAYAVGAWEIRGSAGHVEGSDQESMQACGCVSQEKEGRNIVLHFTRLYCRVHFILKEIRSHTGSSSFSSLPTL